MTTPAAPGEVIRAIPLLQLASHLDLPDDTRVVDVIPTGQLGAVPALVVRHAIDAAPQMRRRVFIAHRPSEDLGVDPTDIYVGSVVLSGVAIAIIEKGTV